MYGSGSIGEGIMYSKVESIAISAAVKIDTWCFISVVFGLDFIFVEDLVFISVNLANLAQATTVNAE